MAKVKTATRDTGSSVSGTLTLYHAEETYSGKPPVYCIGVTAGAQSCGLAAAYWDMDAGVYKYDLSSIGVGGNWELTGEEYEEGKHIFVAWIGQAVWAGEDPETKYQNAGVVATALTRLYAGTDATPWTVSVNWSIAITSSHLWRERTATPSTGRDAAPVYAKETTVTDTWIADRPASASVQCGGATLSATQAWDSAVEQWSPIIERIDSVDLSSYCRGGVADTDYGKLTLNWATVPIPFEGGSKTYPAWSYLGDGNELLLRCTSNADADAGPYGVGVGEPLLVDFSGVSVKDRDGNSVNVRLSGGFKADPRYPETLDWSTTP